MGTVGAGRVVRAVVVSASLAWGTVMAGAAPVAAETPTVTVTPTTAVDGGQVTITTSGLPSGIHAFLQCPASYAGSPDTFVLDSCALLSDVMFEEPLPTFEATVHAVFTTGDGSGTVDCNAEPGGCIVGVKVLLVDNSIVEAWAPISFVPGLDAVPSRGLGDGTTVTLSADSLPAGDRWIAQCTREYADALDPTRAGNQCGPAVPVATVDGAVSADVTAREPLMTVDGGALPCGYRGCVFVLSSAVAPFERVAHVSFGPPSLTIDTPGEVRDNQFVAVTLDGLPGGQTTLHQCALPVSPERCQPGPTVFLDRMGGWTGEVVVFETIQSPIGPVLDCLVEQCLLAAFVDDTAVATAPLVFAPQFGITLYPSGALLDGQSIGVEVGGLPPGGSHTLLQCATSCDGLGTFTAGAEGTLDVTVTVSQRVGQTGYCRDNCRLGMEFEGELRTVGFTMAPGALTVTPGEGLSDGQPVAVAGTDLMPTYAGPVLGPFPTGGWALAQCDAAVGDQPSLYDAFDRCTVLPTPGPVVVEGSTYDETVAPRASITTILGRTVDCGAAPGACVVGLLRFEQDASVSAHLAPVTFAGT